MEYTGNEVVSYSNNTLQVGSVTTGRYYDNYYYNWHYPYYPIYYPSTQYVTEKSKVEQGFRVVAKMLETKIITKEFTIKEFIKLVNDIAEIL